MHECLKYGYLTEKYSNILSNTARPEEIPVGLYYNVFCSVVPG